MRTVKLDPVAVPAEVVTDTVYVPTGAVAGMEIDPVSEVLLVTLTLVTLMVVPAADPDPMTDAVVELVTKFVPEMVTETAVPVVPLDGVIEVTAGADGVIVNVIGPSELPPYVET